MRAVRAREFAAFMVRVAVLVAVTAFSDSAFAQQMVGQSLMNFAANSVIAPLGIFATCIAMAGAFFRPDLAKHAIYAAIICAVLFFIIKAAPQLSTALKN